MLLALYAGDTNIPAGIFDGPELVDHRRVRTVREQTSDEWDILLLNLQRYASFDPAAIPGAVDENLTLEGLRLIWDSTR